MYLFIVLKDCCDSYWCGPDNTVKTFFMHRFSEALIVLHHITIREGIVTCPVLRKIHVHCFITLEDSYCQLLQLEGQYEPFWRPGGKEDTKWKNNLECLCTGIKDLWVGGGVCVGI